MQALQQSFKSGGKKISLEVFEPKSAGKHPAVIILHGADGMAYGGSTYRSLAQQLAGCGYVALVPHYFDRTGTWFANLVENVRFFLPWIETAQDTIAYTGKLPGVDATHVGLVGISLGAYLGLALAAQDARIKAVVDLFGGFPDPFASAVRSMPPVLILHGDADPIVPVHEAYKLEGILKGKNLPYEMKIYPGQGHGFTGSALSDSLDRMQQFFTIHL